MHSSKPSKRKVHLQLYLLHSNLGTAVRVCEGCKEIRGWCFKSLTVRGCARTHTPVNQEEWPIFLRALGRRCELENNSNFVPPLPVGPRGVR